MNAEWKEPETRYSKGLGIMGDLYGREVNLERQQRVAKFAREVETYLDDHTTRIDVGDSCVWLSPQGILVRKVVENYNDDLQGNSAKYWLRLVSNHTPVDKLAGELESLLNDERRPE